ncbi:GNAT family N-acetyltransferase [Parvibaculum sp.]|uniref:GNAT family N-acetyltransferase n=1 Tax=Parvibaculum sp. TaxID=2024848 RepID=UPI003C74CAE6
MTASTMLVFRSAQQQPEPAMPPDVTFEVIEGGGQALRVVAAYAAFYGLSAAMKMVAKVMTRRRSYYVARRGRRIVSDGWMMAGWCSSYSIGARDYVIGPIQTEEAERGQGLAHLCLVRGMNHCLRRGAKWVYIDTTDDNHASRRAIEKSGMMLAREIALP